jgi:proline dehydrogenase
MKSPKLRKSKLFLLSIFLVVPALFYRFGEHWLHLILLYLSGAAWARNFVSSLPVAQHVSARFVAGETVDDAIDAARTMNAVGMSATMDYLGESITTTADAIAAKDEILRLLDKIQEHGIDANVSVKLSQLGLKINQDLVLDNMRQILIRAVHNHNKVRIDMEESAVTQATLDIYRTLRDQDGFGRNVGIVIQSYLYRSKPDVQQLVEDGAWVRLCKGAYAEPQEVAFADKSDTDSNYVQLTKMMLNKNALEKGVYLGVATHDEAIIHSTINHIQSIAFPKDNFEFQMLYGIRRDLQESLVKDGYRMRIYIPYGTAWYPYFMRRLAERPANLWFFISNFFRN